MALHRYLTQPGCVAPPESFTNFTPGAMVELHGWFDDETPTGGAIGVVTRIGDVAERFVGAESGFWDWHLRPANPNQPIRVQLYRPR